MRFDAQECPLGVSKFSDLRYYEVIVKVQGNCSV